MGNTQPHHVDFSSPSAIPKTTRKFFPIPSELSFLYDGSVINFGTSGVYVPLADHVDLASLVQDTRNISKKSKNIGRYSIVFLVEDSQGDGIRTYPIEKNFFTEYRDYLSESGLPYPHALKMFIEHCPCPKDKPKFVKAMMKVKTHLGEEGEDEDDISNAQDHAQRYHHSEQWMLMDMRCSIVQALSQMLLKKDVQKIYGICLDMHSTNDVCGSVAECSGCGPTIEHVLPILTREVIQFFEDIKGAETTKKKEQKLSGYTEVKGFFKCEIDDTFNIFSVVSYSTSY